MTTTPETPEQIAAEAVWAEYEKLPPSRHPHQEKVGNAVVAALRSRGLLVGAPTEEQIKRAALEMHRCEWPGGYGWKTYLPLARAALAAAGGAPQEPREAKQCGPCRRGQHGCCDGNQYVRCDDVHGVLSPDREDTK